MALAVELIKQGITNYDQINKIMEDSGINKWNTAPNSYKQVTYEKAYGFAQPKKPASDLARLRKRVPKLRT